MTRADLRHIDVWVFDLDETLYGRESGVLGAMEGRIEAWLARQRGLGAGEVGPLRRAMRDRYGSTLAALIAEGSPDVEVFLADVHDVPLDRLSPDPALRAALQRLPGRRLVHTNAPGGHAGRVLAALGIADLFEAVFHCGSAGYALKPQMEAFTRIIAAHLFDPTTAVFFEDREANLAPAAELGMTTVLVGDHALSSTASFVHHRTATLAPFLAAAHVRETPA